MVRHPAECKRKQIWAKKLKTISASRFLTWSAQISQKYEQNTAK